MKIFKRLWALLTGKSTPVHKSPKTFILYSEVYQCVGDKYEYTIHGCHTYEEAVNKLIRYLVSSSSYQEEEIESKHWTTVRNQYSGHKTNLPFEVHLGLSGERMDDKQWEKYQIWKQKALKDQRS